MSDGTLAAGQVVRGYRVERWLARGAMGEVYEATQIALDRRIALKVIAREYGTDPSFQERFRREAKTAASIEHANILPVYESGELEDGRLFLAMRFVEGQDLESYLQAHGPMEPGAAIALLSQIAAAIDVAHAKGLVHRDIKPANVMLENRDRRLHSFLTDFGLAKAQMNTGLTAAGAILGTPNYMAPEQFESPNVDGRADVYSFGCLVYRCLTGEVPYPRNGMQAVWYAHEHDPIPVPSAQRPEVPPALDIVVMRAMAKKPAQRADSAGELMQWARQQIGGIPAPPPPAVDETRVATGPAETVAPAATAATTPERRGGHPILARAALLMTLYAPLFAGAYLLGRSL